MKVLVIGSGGREHALVWKLVQSERIEKIFCVPGSDGMAQEPRTECFSLDYGDKFANLREWAVTQRIDLCVVGPEAPLAAGIVDAFDKSTVKMIGPCQQAARLESSKIFAKEFMSRHEIPTADFFVCDTADQALDFVRRCRYGYPLVIKADGLAAGKGVVLVKDYEDAETTILQFMTEKILGEAGARIVVEECLQGRECSFMVFSDGQHYLPMVPSQDHKRVFDHDEGPNTGGMGAFSEDTLLTSELRAEIIQRIVEPTLHGMLTEGASFTGILYCGLMLTEDGPKVLEFNCRFGDPETQPILMRMKTDLLDIFEGMVAGRLNEVQVQWFSRPSVCVVMTSGGYPGKFEKGKLIQGLEKVDRMPDVKVFHAGTRTVSSGTSIPSSPQFETAGGRVLGITAMDNDLKLAVSRAYEACTLIRFDGMHFRRDIAAKFHPM